MCFATTANPAPMIARTKINKYTGIKSRLRKPLSVSRAGGLEESREVWGGVALPDSPACIPPHPLPWAAYLTARSSEHPGRGQKMDASIPGLLHESPVQTWLQNPGTWVKGTNDTERLEQVCQCGKKGWVVHSSNHWESGDLQGKENEKKQDGFICKCL